MQYPSSSSHLDTDRILQGQRAAADRTMLVMMVFLALICLVTGGVAGALGLAAAVALPALAVPALIYRAAPGSLAGARRRHEPEPEP